MLTTKRKRKAKARIVELQNGRFSVTFVNAETGKSIATYPERNLEQLKAVMIGANLVLNIISTTKTKEKP